MLPLKDTRLIANADKLTAARLKNKPAELKKKKKKKGKAAQTLVKEKRGNKKKKCSQKLSE